jgi:hypothetical protein
MKRITKSTGKPVIGLLAVLAAVVFLATGCPNPDTDPEVTSVTVSPASASVAKGATKQFSATVNGNGNPSQSVTWSVAGGGSGTGINASGVLTVGANETAASLTVKATSTADSAKYGATEVTVISITSVTVSPASASVAKGATKQFSATVNGNGNPSQSVTWSVAGGGSGTSINASGVLTVGANETAASLTVKATSTADSAKYGAAAVTVTGSSFNVGATQLTADTWSSGSLASPSDEQWFKFTATAATQYIHVSRATTNTIYVQLYDSNNSKIGGKASFGSSSSLYFYRTVTVGQVYYIQVTASGSGASSYQIAFNTMQLDPGTLSSAAILTADTWSTGSLALSSDEHWFKFTATAAMQYIHVSRATTNTIYVQLYDSNGSKIGGEASFGSSSRAYFYRTVTVDEVYYIQVTASGSSASSYQIAFNTMQLAPGTLSSAANLTANTWSTGNLASPSSEQWFKFTATAATQYIHISRATSNTLYAQVYDSNGGTVGSEASFGSSSSPYFYRTVTIGQVYYIQVTASGSGASSYRIAFNTMPLSPGTIDTAATLAADTWSDGTITANGQQWFSFTATAGTQYIHIEYGMLTSLYVRLYDSNGGALGDSIHFSGATGNTRYTALTVASGQTYYLKVTPYSSSGSGTYKIAFNTIKWSPGATDTATSLTEDDWTDGSINSSSGGQLFTFTATATTQYIHVSFGTLTHLYVQLYDSAGNTVGDRSNLYSSTRSKMLAVTSGQTYYVWVTPYSGSGAYQIAFSTSAVAP